MQNVIKQVFNRKQITYNFIDKYHIKVESTEFLCKFPLHEVPYKFFMCLHNKNVLPGNK